jgi:phosphopantothenoylcysteine decarboxylase / phosphopantothenate---cysteine ligase
MDTPNAPTPEAHDSEAVPPEASDLEAPDPEAPDPEPLSLETLAVPVPAGSPMEPSARILVGVSGGIAAYKVCQLVSQLVQVGMEVRVVMTDAAQQFVAPLTFATLSRHGAYTDQDFWQASHSRPLHIELGEWADLIVLAPLTAHTLGKLAHGLADNLLTNILLASTAPVILAPAMNTDMWEQASVQRNWKMLLDDRRYRAAPPESGLLACDRVGAGRMAEPETLLVQVRSLLLRRDLDLLGKQILVSAGSTREFLDPVRYLGNPSSGKMGAAIAQAASYRGAQVTLVHGPMQPADLQTLGGVRLIPILTAGEMRAALLQEIAAADWTFMAAAVADLKPKDYFEAKVPKANLPKKLALTEVPDIIANLSNRRQRHQRLIGFAAQTGEYEALAKEKMQNKDLDAIVANPVDLAQGGFGSDLNQGVWLDRWGRREVIPLCSKLEMAHRILDAARRF